MAENNRTECKCANIKGYWLKEKPSGTSLYFKVRHNGQWENKAVDLLSLIDEAIDVNPEFAEQVKQILS